MNENNVHFLFEDPDAPKLTYRPSPANDLIAKNAIVGVNFVQNQVILDDWWLFGGTRWSRTLFRFKHPIVYLKRGLLVIYHRIKRIFVKERLIQCNKIKKRK